jgi:hypothetical protein
MVPFTHQKEPDVPSAQVYSTSPLPLHLSFEEFGEVLARVLDQLAHSSAGPFVSEVKEVGIRDLYCLNLRVRPCQILVRVPELIARPS